MDTHHFYRGDQEVMEAVATNATSSGAVLRHYIRLPDSVDEVLLMLDDDASDPACVTGCVYYAQTNRLGSTILTTDETGAV